MSLFLSEGLYKRQTPLIAASTAEQLYACPTEIPVQGWVENGVQCRVEVSQPKNDRVSQFVRMVLSPHSHVCEVRKIGEPANDKSTKHYSQGHCGFVFPRSGNCIGGQSKGWSGCPYTTHLNVRHEERVRKVTETFFVCLFVFSGWMQ